MFKCDELTYIQLQKTAGNHIVGLLTQLFGGEVSGKHNPATPEQLRAAPYFIGSIRNPWDWYVSLWTFGVGGRGILRRRLTERSGWSTVKATLKNPAANYRQGLLALTKDLTKDVNRWRRVYTRSDDVGSFRRWLAMIHGDGGGDVTAGEEDYDDPHLGLMTRRYLSLYCRRDVPTPARVAARVPLAHTAWDERHFARLREFEAAACYIDYFVRQESLAETLCAALENIRPLTAAEKSQIAAAAKTNTSHRPLTLAAYYDPASVDLIRTRDRLIVEKFAYQPPI